MNVSPDSPVGESASIERAEVAVDALELPVIPGEMLSFASSLQDTFGTDDRFSAVEISRDRTEVIVWWHGDPSEALAQKLKESPVAVRISGTVLVPGDLRRAAETALASGSVSSVAPEKDGTGLTITFDEKQDRSISADAMSSLESDLGVPITLSDHAAPVPAARQADLYGMGGARVWRYSSGSLTNACTTGFAVTKSGQSGVMFAAHCANSGDQTVMWPNNTGSTVYYYGNDGIVDSWVSTYDAAVIKTASNTGAVYTGAWNSAQGILIKGASNVPIGTELCYSGSYSGFICGNVVTQTGLSYSLSGVNGAAVNVQAAVRTDQANGTPAVGQGDSGGPGVIPVLINGTASIVAGTIISAIPGGSGSTCSGISDGRLCSSTGFSTLVTGALAATGWSIKVE